MKYRARKFWRHFKYKILELFFGKPELKRMIDLDRLDFEDAVKLTQINEEKWLNKEEYEFFNRKESYKYGLQYALARQMADTLAKHIQVSEMYDTDREQHLCIGRIVLAERKDQ